MTPAAASPLQITLQHDGDGCTVVRPVGELDRLNYQQLRDSLLKCATEIPVAIIVDVGALIPQPASLLSVFSTVWTRVADWPAVPLMLVAPTPGSRDLLRSSYVDRFVPVHADMNHAKRSLEAPPPRRRVTLALAWSTASAALARDYVLATCDAWGIPADQTEDARLLANELVENNLMHTHAEPLLRLELRRGLLTIAVSDNDPGLAVLGKGNGLKLVGAIATVWGCMPTMDGGKIVWTVLRIPDR